VVSHPDRPQANQAHLTVLQQYKMHNELATNEQTYYTRASVDVVVAYLF